MIPKFFTEFLYLCPVTLICWVVGAFLFWRWDLGGYRSEYLRKKKEKELSDKYAKLEEIRKEVRNNIEAYKNKEQGQ